MIPGNKIIPIQPTPIVMKNAAPHDVPTNKITLRTKKGKESLDE